MNQYCSLHRLQRQLTTDLHAIEQKVNSGAAGISSGEWLTAKRVLVYWADEVLTRHIRDWDDYSDVVRSWMCP
ncbi:MAG: hypothetical protein GY758_13685 [Fuerstiella sp.]|nr:hypothetical protein [Fuerstiella sp.]